MPASQGCRFQIARRRLCHLQGGLVADPGALQLYSPLAEVLVTRSFRILEKYFLKHPQQDLEPVGKTLMSTIKCVHVDTNFRSDSAVK